MTDPHTKAIEDAARALVRRAFNDDFSSLDAGEAAVWRAAARHCVDAYLATVKAQGWKLCPREPTDQMVEAGYSAGMAPVGDWTTLELAFPAMHDTAPEPDHD